MKAYSEMSDPQREEVLRGVERKRRRQLVDDVKHILAEPWGRRLMHWLIYEHCGVKHLSFNEYNSGIKDGVTAAMHMARLEGRREAGIDLEDQLQMIDLPKYSVMMAEKIRDQQAELALLQDIQSADEDGDDSK